MGHASRLLKLAGAPRRVVVAGAVVIALLICATATTIWRYDSASTPGDNALAARTSIVRTNETIISFWRERESINEYLISPSPHLLAEVATGRARFASAANAAA